jgi:hypothetical protein
MWDAINAAQPKTPDGVSPISGMNTTMLRRRSPRP